jgi:hypothetical protein
MYNTIEKMLWKEAVARTKKSGESLGKTHSFKKDQH